MKVLIFQTVMLLLGAAYTYAAKHQTDPIKRASWYTQGSVWLAASVVVGVVH